MEEQGYVFPLLEMSSVIEDAAYVIEGSLGVAGYAGKSESRSVSSSKSGSGCHSACTSGGVSLSFRNYSSKSSSRSTSSSKSGSGSASNSGSKSGVTSRTSFGLEERL